MDGRRGQSETLGFALILGFTLISVGAIAMFGGTSLQTTQQNIGAQNAENAMSQFDSRASMVALGDTNNQAVALGAGQQGTYTVRPDAGWIRVVHENETGGNRTVIHNGTLGAVQYRGETTEIGYQGGGVWRQDEGSVMLSPPEFHYRRSTLTLPIIQIDGQGSVAGNPTARVRDGGPGDTIFPNDAGVEPSSNPVKAGKVTVTVQSSYYEGWGRYFETRTEGNVSTDDTNRTVTLELVAPAIDDDFDMPLDGNSMTLQGIVGHQIDAFDLTLFADDEDNADFSNLDWSLCAESGGQEFALNVQKGNTGNPTHGDQADTHIYYSPDGSSFQTWHTDAFTYETEANESEDWNGDGDEEDIRLVLNLTSTETANYEEIKSKEFNCNFDPNSFQDNATFEGHSIDKEPVNYSSDESAEIGFITNHYLALLGPTVDLTVNDATKANQDSAAGSVSEELSSGFVDYNGSEGYYLTYMHITENPINVTVE